MSVAGRGRVVEKERRAAGTGTGMERSWICLRRRGRADGVGGVVVVVQHWAVARVKRVRLVGGEKRLRTMEPVMTPFR